MLRRGRIPELLLAALLLGGAAAFGAAGPSAKAGLFLAILALGVGTAIVALGRRERLRVPAVVWPLAGMLLLGSAQLVSGWSVYPWATKAQITEIAVWIVLAMTARNLLAAPTARRAFCDVLLWGAAAIAVAALLYRALDPAAPRFGPFTNPNHYAVFAELTLPLAIAAAAGERRFWGLLLTGLLYGSVIASGSRAGAVIATAEVALIPLLLSHKAGIGAAVRNATVTAIVAVLGAAAAGWHFLWERFGSSALLAGRLEILQSALVLVAAHPWTGTGLGTFEVVYPAAAPFDPGLRVDHAHNDLLEAAVEGGIPLAALCLAAVAVTLSKARHAPWMWGAYAALLHSLVDFPLHIPALAALTVTLLSISSRRHATNPLRR
ncbi:MAG: O-antigen ligase family protein [Bryobacterales bacterium]|nr:O-antigen ligase family protein [Bryobacterales bacterium]